MSVNPVLNRLNKVDNGRAGRNAEKRMAKRVGGRQQVGSGAIDSMKGDIIKGGFLIESKTTVGQSFSVKKEWLLKVYQEALEMNKTPVFAINFTDAAGNSEKRERWMAIPEHLWLELIADDCN